MKKYITRGQMAKMLGMTKSQIRFYEKKGLINPETDDNGYGMYDFEELDVLEIILVLRDLGVPIKEMKHLINSEAFEYESYVKRSLESVEKEIKVLEQKKAWLETKLMTIQSDVINAFTIEAFKDMKIYIVDEFEDEEFNLRRIYDLLMKYGLSYLDYNYELCEYHDGQRIQGFVSQNAIPSYDFQVFEMPSGDYFCYTFSFSYDENVEKYLEILNQEIKKQGIETDDAYFFVEHFSRKFYYKNKAVGTVAKRVKR